MELFNLKTEFSARLFTAGNIIVTILFFLFFLVMLKLSWGHFWAMVIAPPLTLAMQYSELRKMYNTCVNWIELLIVDEEKKECHLKLLVRDEVFMDTIVPIKDLRLKLEPIPGKVATYKLLIFLEEKLIFSQFETDEMNRNKMQEILRCFHPEDRMARKVL